MGQAVRSRQAQESDLARSIVSHWKREFEGALVVDEPFSHFYCDRVWPSDIYQDLLRLLPSHELYEPLNIKEWVNTRGVSTRDKCFLPDILGCMDPEREYFWHQVWLALTAESLKDLVFRKLKRDIALRLRVQHEDVEKTEVSVHISLARDIEDYRIKPHPDGQPAIVTAQFYMPMDTSQQDLGTSFYVERPPWTRFLFGRHEEVKKMPFLPNSGYFFAVNDLPVRRSLHGRERIRAGAGVRNSMLVRWSKPGSARKHGNTGVSSTHEFF